MAREATTPAECYFYYPHLACVVGVRDDARSSANFAPVTWATPLSSDPPLYGVCISPRTHTHHLLLASGEFTVNFLPRAEQPLVASLGELSGRAVDKVKELSLALEAGRTIATPGLAASYVFAECLLVERHHLGDQTLFVGAVQHVQAQAGAFDKGGVLRLGAVAPLLYLGGNRWASAVAAPAAGRE
jgi:flavin reductase (DIM6/NTAB) family NADH-FMN oxidoreductase RutF